MLCIVIVREAKVCSEKMRRKENEGKIRETEDFDKQKKKMWELGRRRRRARRLIFDF